MKLPYGTLQRDHVHVNFGFGYDVTNDDYKVVRIVQFEKGSEKGSFHSDVMVFSFRSSCWRRLEEELPYYLRYEDQPGTYLNGSLHWIASDKMERPANKLEPLIVAFDLGTEKWGLVPRPPYTDTGFIVRLVVLGGSLCTYKTYFLDDWENGDLVLDHVDVWVMKEYGIRDSWAMLISLEQPDKYVGHTVLPLANSKSGKEVLVKQDNRRFLWTSFEGDSIKIVDTEIGNLRGFLHFNSYIYLGSLVNLSSNDGTSDMKKQLNQDKGGNKKALKKRGDDFLSKGFKLKL